jgi:hypothetical protein
MIRSSMLVPTAAPLVGISPVLKLDEALPSIFEKAYSISISDKIGLYRG